MHVIGSILEILNAQMEKPPLYGWFHILSLALCVLAGIWLYRKWPVGQEVQIRRLLLAISLTVIGLEIYKQINYSFHYDSTAITFDYQWYAFPFQFCSTPMYISLLAAVIPNQKIHRSLCAYLVTYSFFAGLCVMAYPGDVFTTTVGINIQTMVCHGSMMVLGVYLLMCGYVPADRRTILRALPVFLTLVACAVVMNEIAYCTGLLERETFNMFFVSPYCAPSLPVYSLVQNVVPFPGSLAIYVLIFTLAGYLVMKIASFIHKKVQ